MTIIAKVQIAEVYCIIVQKCDSFSITGDIIEYTDSFSRDPNVANKVSEIQKLWLDGVLLIDNYSLV